METDCARIEKWDFYELRLRVKTNMNPFLEATLECSFTGPSGSLLVKGFYDGDDTFVVRFMPEETGEYRFVTRSNVGTLDGISGKFQCIEPRKGNHGPVKVFDSSNFAFADGVRYFPIGTTCYVWNLQGEELEARTLESLKGSPFNKIRMCVFPKRYRYNYNEPESYPFEGGLTGTWDKNLRDRYEGSGPMAEWNFNRLNPEYFKHLEKRILDLRALGIEADLILFHPYDFGAWGFDRMPRGVNERYLRYIVSRLAAFRNVWWSFANEYDLMSSFRVEDWDHYMELVQREDPYNHLRSIHNCRGFYDHTKPWVTHCSIQTSELMKTDSWIDQYAKPVVIDECSYEGDIEMPWGDLSPQEMVQRFWIGFCRGGYVGHSETYVADDEVLWWSKGGRLKGGSAPRIAFLRRILEESGIPGLKPVRKGEKALIDGWASDGVAHFKDEYFLSYIAYGRQPAKKTIHLGAMKYSIDLIDTWNMKIEPLGVFTGDQDIPFPKKAALAIRMVKV